MQWNREHIDYVARASADADLWAFERTGLIEIKDACVLDVGSFDGFNTRLKFSPYQNIARVVGIDACEEALRIAYDDNEDGRFCWEYTNFEDYETADESFDVAYLSHTFQHLPDRAIAASKLYRLLKPGGYVIIKTVDDSAKVSYPDPDGLMLKVMDYYTNVIKPVSHTALTDRDNGSKCYTLLRDTGFEDVSVRVFHANTCGLSPKERERLFERITYFRRGTNAQVPDDVRSHIAKLLDAWHELFMHDNYYFDSPTFMVVGRKPNSSDKLGEIGAVCAGKRACANASITSIGEWELCPMREEDLGEVMSIEIEAFSDPWAPVAYAMEIRHNPAANYVIAKKDREGVCGYIGWWVADKAATIMHIAVKKSVRRRGLGQVLLEHACLQASVQGANDMRLFVRESNAGARAFYCSSGFVEDGCEMRYFASPSEDAIRMHKEIGSDLGSMC